jgi:hypothetical protein
MAITFLNDIYSLYCFKKIIRVLYMPLLGGLLDAKSFTVSICADIITMCCDQHRVGVHTIPVEPCEAIHRDGEVNCHQI